MKVASIYWCCLQIIILWWVQIELLPSFGGIIACGRCILVACACLTLSKGWAERERLMIGSCLVCDNEILEQRNFCSLVISSTF